MIDQLSEGDLLGGKRVAVTGTIDINSKVGAIGGLTSKASAVLQSGAKYFLVPTSQGEEDIANARKVVGDQVEIIPVATLDEALAALERIGGDALPARRRRRAGHHAIALRSRATAPRQVIATIFVARRPTLALDGTFVFTS